MLDPKEITRLAAILQELPQKVAACEHVAHALIDTGQAWVHRSDLLTVLLGTDYERARDAVRDASYQALRKARKIRRGMLSPDTIRVSAYLERVANCCNQCPAVNRSGLGSGQPFSCLIANQLKSQMNQAFQFRRDEKGQIIERK